MRQMSMTLLFMVTFVQGVFRSMAIISLEIYYSDNCSSDNETTAQLDNHPFDNCASKNCPLYHQSLSSMILKIVI